MNGSISLLQMRVGGTSFPWGWQQAGNSPEVTAALATSIRYNGPPHPPFVRVVLL